MANYFYHIYFPWLSFPFDLYTLATFIELHSTLTQYMQQNKSDHYVVFNRSYTEINSLTPTHVSI